MAEIDLNPGGKGVVFPASPGVCTASAGLVLAAGMASEALSVVFPRVWLPCEPGRGAGMGQEQPGVPRGCEGAVPGVLSPGCPHRTPPSPSRSSTPSSKRPPTSRCDPSSSPSSRWVSSLGRVGFVAAFLHRAFGSAFGGAPTRVESCRAGAGCNKARGQPAGGHLQLQIHLKISLFFNLPFNFVLTLHCHPALEGFAWCWHVWQDGHCQQMFEPSVPCPLAKE